MASGETVKNLDELYPDLSSTGGGQRPIHIRFNPSIITEVSLPDDRTGNGHKWQFQYNSFGEIARVVTPSNGAIEYKHIRTLVPSEPGVNRPGPEIFRRVFERRVFASKTDSTERGKTTYSDPTVLDSNGNSTVTETSFDESGKRLAITQHKFVNSPIVNYGINTDVLEDTGYRPWMEGKEIETQEIELNSTGQNTNRRRITTYTFEQRAGVAWIANANTTLLNQPENDPRLIRVQTQLEDGKISKVDYQYDLFNNIILETITGFDNRVIRKIQRSYLQTNPFQNGVNYRTELSIHQRSLLVTESIIGINPINNLEFTETVTQFEYDKYSTLPLVPRTFNALDNSRNPAYGTGYQTRGNTTGIIRGTTNNQSMLNSQYDIAGNLIKTLGPLSNQEVSTEYDSEHFAFPTKTTQIVSGAPQPFVLERAYDLSTGAILSSSGLNKLAGETTSYVYNDPLDRLTKVVRPIGAGESSYTYSNASTYPATVNASSKLDSTRNLVSTTFYDGLLNPIKSTTQDPNGDVTSESTYDGLGRVIKITNPQREVTSDNTNGYTESTYDGFGRIVSVESFTATNGSTGKVLSVYNGSDVEVTDQAGRKRKSVSDALGRLVSVFEPDPSGTLSLETKYNYDARANLLKVEQGVQTRTFIYDSLGRLTGANVPESGLISYSYDAASNLLARTDAKAITTTYTYDSLNRIKTKNYSDSTPDVNYFYDTLPTALPTGVSLPANYQPGIALGRLVAVATPNTPSQQATSTFYSYDVVGRITNGSQLLDTQQYSTSSSYNLASLPASLTYPSGHNVTNTYNIAGQITDVMRDGQSISGQATYTPSGAIESHRLGNGLYHQVKYNSRLQPTQITLGSSLTGQAAEDKWKQEYNYAAYDLNTIQSATTTPTISTNQSQNNGNIGHIKLTPGSGQNPINEFFAYDELNRLKLAKEFFVEETAETCPPFVGVSSFTGNVVSNVSLSPTYTGQTTLTVEGDPVIYPSPINKNGTATFTVDLTDPQFQGKTITGSFNGLISVCGGLGFKTPLIQSITTTATSDSLLLSPQNLPNANISGFTTNFFGNRSRGHIVFIKIMTTIYSIVLRL